MDFFGKEEIDMKRRMTRSIVVFLLLSIYFVLPTWGQEKKGTDEIYTIKQGDTLWEISAQFLKDPFLWPKLWQRNPYITNPHWIYPGKPIRLSTVEEVKKEPPQEVAQETPREAAIEPQVQKAETPPAPPPVVKEEKPQPVAEPVEEKKMAKAEPNIIGWPDIRSAGFFSDLDHKGIGMVLDSREGKNLMAEGDIVYLTFKSAEPVLVGNRYTIFRASEPLIHPVTGTRMGRRYNITGILQVIDQQGHFFTAKIIESFDAVYKGDMIQPYSKAIMEGVAK
jgi:hypothetical protein